MNDEFSNRLQTAMSLRNMKQVELCEKTGISSSLINKYLKGKALARQDKLYILAKVLDVNEAWLMGFDADIKRMPDKSRKFRDNTLKTTFHNEIDIEGLDEENIKEINRFVEFIKNKKRNDK